MKLLSYVVLLLSISLSAVAEESEPAKVWLERLSNSLNKLNFSTSFVVVKNNQARRDRDHFNTRSELRRERLS